jgi:hypothetical protein
MGLRFWGWPDHPQWPGGGFGHPLSSHMGWLEATPRPLGVVWPPPKSQTHFFFFLAFRGGRTTPKGLGVVRPPPKAQTHSFFLTPNGLGWLWPPLTGHMGWLKPPPGPWGWSGHPQNLKPIFFFFLAFRGGRTTPKGLGVVWPPPKAQTHSFFLSFFLAFQGGRTTSKGLGVVWPPQKPKPILSFFLSFWPFGVARPPPRA